MKKQRKHYAPEEKVASLRRHLVEGVTISDLFDESRLQACGPAFSRRCASRSRPVSQGVARWDNLTIRAAPHCREESSQLLVW